MLCTAFDDDWLRCPITAVMHEKLISWRHLGYEYHTCKGPLIIVNFKNTIFQQSLFFKDHTLRKLHVSRIPEKLVGGRKKDKTKQREFERDDDAVDRRKLGFYVLLFKQQFKASLEKFNIFNYVAEGQNEQIKREFDLKLVEIMIWEAIYYKTNFNCVGFVNLWLLESNIRLAIKCSPRVDNSKQVLFIASNI